MCGPVISAASVCPVGKYYGCGGDDRGFREGVYIIHAGVASPLSMGSGMKYDVIKNTPELRFFPEYVLSLMVEKPSMPPGSGIFLPVPERELL